MLPLRLSLLSRRALCSSVKASPGWLMPRSGLHRYTTIAGGTKSYAIPCRGSACQKPSPIYQHIGKRAFATKQNATNHVVSEAAATKAGPKATHPENKGKIVEQTRNATDMAIIKQLMRYVWPKDDAGVKARVIIALSLLVGGKVILSPVVIYVIIEFCLLTYIRIASY